MKKNIGYIFLMIIPVGLLFAFGNFIVAQELNNTKHYDAKLIFEKKFNTETQIDFFSLANNDNNKPIFELYFPAGPFKTTYRIPKILNIDRNGNIFIIYDTILKVFDVSGNLIMQIVLPNDFNLDYWTSDNENEYLFFSKYETSEKVVYRINISKSEYLEVDKNYIDRLDPLVKPPLNEKDWAIKKKNAITLDGVFYCVGLGRAEATLFANANGHYNDPGKIFIYKCYASFDKVFTNPIDEENAKLIIPEHYKYDSLKISDFINEKIVCLTGWYITKYGDIYFTGIKSNEIENNVKDIKGHNISVDLVDPTFILYKLENTLAKE
jgi:hypothetical protein